MNNKTTEILAEILAERGKTHGDFTDNANITQRLKSVMRDGLNDYDATLSTVHREALDMIALKIGRILTGDPNNADHWQDIAGYAILVADRVGKV